MPPKSPEQEKRYQIAKSFKGVNTKANRTAIEDEEFSWLENVQPIGFGNLKTVPAPINVTLVGGGSPGGNVTFSNVVTSLQAVNINNVDYIMAFEANGGAEYFALQTATSGTIAASGTFSTANVSATQWKNERAVIIDPSNGYFTWDSNNVISIGSIGTIEIINPGHGYTQTPDIVISAPDNVAGQQAAASATISQNAGTIQYVTINNPGDGYTWVPNVTIDAPQTSSGTQAVATATILGGGVVALNLVSPGSGYTAPPNVTISGGRSANIGGNLAIAAAVLNYGVLTAISLDTAGSGYTKSPTVTITGGHASNSGTAVAELISFSTGTISALVIQGGGGYSNPANLTVTISGGNPTNIATAVAAINGDQVTAIVMINPGKGYTTPPDVIIAGGGGSNATATAIVQSNSPNDIATFSGRTWIAQGRVVFYTAADSYSDFSSVSAGNFEINDTTLHNNIKSLITANNFLYIYGEDSINVFSDVIVQSNGTTIFTNTNVSASIGSRYASAVFPYYRTIMFQNDFGMFALVGATTTKLSDPLDGIIPLIDFTKPLTAGQVLINNILCGCFCFTYKDPVAGPRQIQAVFFEKKWFFTSQGNIKYIVNVPFQGQQQLYGTDGISLFQLYAAPTSAAIAATVQSALWALNDPIRTKQALKIGVEATLTSSTTLYATIDSELGSSPQITFENVAEWTNNIGAVAVWTSNVGAVSQWLLTNSYNLFKSDAQQYGKYLGFTITSNTGALTINTLELEHELRVRF